MSENHLVHACVFLSKELNTYYKKINKIKYVTHTRDWCRNGNYIHTVILSHRRRYYYYYHCILLHDRRFNFNLITV